MSKYKLIDILVMISKRELKEYTKVKWDEFEYICKKDFLGEKYLERKDEECKFISILEDMELRHLNAEVEIIEPDHFTDVGKMATEKIEELNVKYLCHTLDGRTTLAPIVAMKEVANKLKERH